MPARTDIETILILGSGPIVIGQACEFDYSGTQAVKALRREGYRLVLVNSNPATIMTDPELADATYVEPLTPEIVERIIDRERPDALLPTVGGQTALNLALALVERGTLESYGVELIGAGIESIRIAEDRERFKAAMSGLGLGVPESVLLRSIDEAGAAVAAIGFPAILRPSFTLGGTGSGVANDDREFRALLRDGLRQSPVGSVLVEKSVLGWKEYELEVIRDRAGNGIVVCSIENFDAMGVHTGDSITVAPAQTLTDREYQHLRDDALKVLNAVGVATGGANVQFAVNPDTGERLVIEMNPRVSRSSALASKATGYPIAKIASLLAVGYTLDELPNEITGTSSACFEPSIDYTVVKVPRWAFEKFPGASSVLGTSMRSVGEVMAIGRTFREALQKALRALEQGLDGWDSSGATSRMELGELRAALARPNADRLAQLHEALRRGLGVEELFQITRIDPWFLDNLAQLVEVEGRIRSFSLDELPREVLRTAKREGFSDRRIAQLLRSSEAGAVNAGAVRARREALGVRPVFRRVDTCAAEFLGRTPYLYSTWEDGACEAEPTARRKVIVLGSGPNRIGQGIEFDTVCCHAVEALRAEGVEAILVNCNPETVSTDYDTSDRLYFEPLRLEEVLHIVERETPSGVIVTLGGQTPLKLAGDLARANVPILGTPVEAIDRAEDRDRFAALAAELEIPVPRHGTARSLEEALRVAESIGYPVMVRPSYVLGGRAMRIVYDAPGLLSYFDEAASVAPEHPVLIDRFLEDAVEFDVDAVCDGRRVVIGGILQHIEEAGIHSGDSFAVLPPYRVTPIEIEVMSAYTEELALALGVVGLVNVQFAIFEGEICVLEVNPRASRTVPFIEKATGLPLSEIATRCMLGIDLEKQGVAAAPAPARVFVKAPVFPFRRFPESDRLLGPEMRSTGEVMGVGTTFGAAFAKAQLATGHGLPERGTIFISVNDRDKPGVRGIAHDLLALGFKVLATTGTASYLARHNLACESVPKVGEGSPDLADRIREGAVQMVINTPLGRKSYYDEKAIRQAATLADIPCITTLSGARAAVDGIRALREGLSEVVSLQELREGRPPQIPPPGTSRRA
jgi:carbamoyl-phosphate synthase large subunit